MKSIIYSIFRMAAVALLLMPYGCQQTYELELPLSTNTDEILVTKDAGQAYIMVYSTGSWSIGFDRPVAWAELSTSEGSGNEFVHIDYQANTDLSRGVNIVIVSGDLRRTVYFAQEAGMSDAMYSFEDRSISLLKGAITVEAATTTNLPQSNIDMAEAAVIYDNIDSEEWIGNIVVMADHVSFDVAENNTGADRMATLTVRFPAAYEGEGVSTSIWVSQSSEEAYVRFGSDEYAVNPDGGAVEIPYESNFVSNLYDFDVTFTLVSPDGGEVSWILDAVVEGNMFKAQAEPNKHDLRSASLTLHFTDEQGVSHSGNTVTLTQQKTTTGIVDGDGGDGEEPKDPETEF